MKIINYKKKSNVDIDHNALPFEIINLPDLDQVRYFVVPRDANEANKRANRKIIEIYIRNLNGKIKQVLSTLLKARTNDELCLFIYDKQTFCVVVELPPEELTKINSVPWKLNELSLDLAKNCYKAYGLRESVFEVVLKMGWMPRDFLYNHLEEFKVENVADRVTLMNKVWSDQAQKMDIRVLETQREAIQSFNSHVGNESFWAFLPAHLQPFLKTAPELLSPGKEWDFSVGFFVAYLPLSVEWGVQHQQVKNYVRVLGTLAAYKQFFDTRASQSPWAYQYLLRSVPGKEDLLPKLSAISTRLADQQWCPVRDYLQRLSIQQDHFLSLKEWAGIMSSAVTVAQIMAQITFANIFSINFFNLYLLFLIPAVPGLYQFQRFFLDINSPAYSGASFLCADFLKRFLLQHREKLFATALMIQPFFYTLAAVNKSHNTIIPDGGVYITLAVVFFAQVLRTSAVWMRWTETVGLATITKNGFLESVLWGLENIGFVRLSCALWPFVTAWINSQAVFFVMTTHLGLSQPVGIFAFCCSLIANAAFPRAYDVNRFLRPFAKTVISSLEVNNKISRFFNDFVRFAFENPIIEPLISLRIFPQLFAMNYYSFCGYILFTPLLNLCSSLAKGYLLDVMIAKTAEELGRPPLFPYAMSTLCFFSQCGEMMSMAKEMRYEIVDGPLQHAEKEPIAFQDRFKLPKERRYVRVGFLFLSAALSIVVDIFLKKEDQPFLTRSIFSYLSFIFLYTLLDQFISCFPEKQVEKSSRVQPVSSAKKSKKAEFDQVVISNTPKKSPGGSVLSPRRRAEATSTPNPAFRK